MFLYIPNKAWTAIDRLLTIWKFDRSAKLKWEFFQAANTTVWLHHLDSSKALGEKSKKEQYKDAMCCFEQILETAPQKPAVVQPLTSHVINSPGKMNKICWVMRKKTHKQHSPMNLYTRIHQC